MNPTQHTASHTDTKKHKNNNKIHEHTKSEREKD